MEISINLQSDSPMYSQIYEQIKKTIITKKIASHSKLPSKRNLALDLNVSVHTVKEAYEQLNAEGFIYSKERAGYFVAPFEFEWQPPIKVAPLSTTVEIKHPKVDIDFQNGHIDTTSFPYAIWRKLYNKHFRPENLINNTGQGEPSLRFAIADYVQRSRGVQCEPSQVFIYGGTQHQLQALCYFFGPSISVGIEEPGFKRARAIFSQSCLHTYGIEVDEFGVKIPTKKLNLLYTTPAHQFPLGMVMSVKRRASLLKWASAENAYIIEDDYDSEYRFKGLPIPSLAQMDQLQHVIYFGTFSKTLVPSIRISYMILPSKLVSSFSNFYQEQKTVVSKIDQLLLADFISQGLFDKHLSKMRTLYRKKQQALIAAIKTHLSDKFEIIGEKAGLHIILKLPDYISEEEAIEKAISVGVQIYPSSNSYVGPPTQQMVIIGYGGLTFEEIEEGILRLKKVWCQF
ncbi:MocR-like pyridoxine biosynthesis transcription factor PdxR [Rummeliibacillus pycnus]|uniref:MocR-like pyridoxine biosynthesis transcription factor PdxR n=1 Tax=Rummeliibacillus pycnus TaxID=101070 RepID=UPI001FEB9F31|nr:PLP-dependent aminotransferase family protein [Rummeliibacillus pycnus]